MDVAQKNETVAGIMKRTFASGNLKCSSNIRILQWNILADGKSFKAFKGKYTLSDFIFVDSFKIQVFCADSFL